ncbi:MAG TPA: hemolysin family protein [Acidobacteriaceae bacterium]|jgi:CBS domain containing-hemolysin-like protein|nr:hemolysin family protein [Acidobacteriaceae bacterium]
MRITVAVIILLLLAVLTLASYVDRLYSEMGKFLAREFEENIDAWEQRVEPRLGLSREHIRLSAAILTQLSLGCVMLLFGVLIFYHRVVPQSLAAEIGQAVLGIIVVILFCNQFLPFVFFTRTRGEWIVRWSGVLLVLFYLMTPVTLFLGFLLSIAALAESAPKTQDETVLEAVEALIEAGEEEGILEESDRELVRSVVEFGDKLVREVMTPRPRMFAVPAETTLEEFLRMLETEDYSRVPVYKGSLDHITGIVFAHDLLRIHDEETRTRTVADIQRPAMFIPETKRVNELLREMQRAKQHMDIVIDEYGGVAGLVTIEDLIEEIVGAITDEHETEEAEAVTREPDGSWVVPGNLEVDRMGELLDAELPEQTEATTVAGLVSEVAGRIPQAGEVIEQYGVRFEILSSTDRRIERLRVGHAENGGQTA